MQQAPRTGAMGPRGLGVRWAGQVLFIKYRSLSTKMMIWLSQDGRNAEKDGGSSFVVSPQQQLYRLHVSSPKFHQDLPVVSTV